MDTTLKIKKLYVFQNRKNDMAKQIKHVLVIWLPKHKFYLFSLIYWTLCFPKSVNNVSISINFKLIERYFPLKKYVLPEKKYWPQNWYYVVFLFIFLFLYICLYWHLFIYLSAFFFFALSLISCLIHWLIHWFCSFSTCHGVFHSFFHFFVFYLSIYSIR